MLPATWDQFFAAEAGTSAALLGLLFVSFSVFVTRQDLDTIEWSLFGVYFQELLSALALSMSALVPPHYWWAGSLVVGGVHLGAVILLVILASMYRHAYKRMQGAYRHGARLKATQKVRDSRRQLPATAWRRQVVKETTRAQIYVQYRRSFQTVIFAVIEALVFFVASLIGLLSQFTTVPILDTAPLTFLAAVLKVPVTLLPLEVASILAAWYLISGGAGSQLFLRKLSMRSYARGILTDSTTDQSGHSGNDAILVVGASGALGGLICQELVKTGHNVRAMVRHTTRTWFGLMHNADVTALNRLGVEVVEADLNDPLSLATAVAGCSTIIYTASAVVPSRPRESVAGDSRRAWHMINAAVASSVQRIIFVSGINRPQIRSMLMQSKAEVESYIQASGLDYTIIRVAALMEVHLSVLGTSLAVAPGPSSQVRPTPTLGRKWWFNRGYFDRFRESIDKDKVARIVGSGHSKVSWVATGDVAHIVAATIDNPACANQIIEVGSEPALSWEDTVHAFDRVLGQKTEIHRIWPMQLKVMGAILSLFSPAAGELVRTAGTAAEIDLTTDNSQFKQLFPHEHLQSVEEFLRERMTLLTAVSTQPGGWR